MYGTRALHGEFKRGRDGRAGGSGSPGRTVQFSTLWRKAQPARSKDQHFFEDFLR
jgi:hypothetical protein